jgi:hypothetical protein
MCGGAIIADFVPAGARRPATSSTADDTTSASVLSGTVAEFFLVQLVFRFVVYYLE